MTTSLCPVCLRRLPATLVRSGEEVWLERTCPDHGETRALVWRGPPDYDEWCQAGAGRSCCDPPENPACPTACGLCEGHVTGTCCVLLEVTARCDLQCPVCFAGASREAPADPSMETIEGWYRRLLDVAPGCNVQLSGGEPTMRDDLPQLIARGRSLGLSFFQLNTNGLRLATEDGYAERLAKAGLDTVFLQFDGVDDAVHLALRGRRLAALKEQAIERCAAAGLGVVLVPTVVRGVNLDQLGAVLDFGLERLPTVRGVHIQPLALLGRYPDPVAAAESRVTLPDAMRALAVQSGGRIRLEDLKPGDCEHALCSFSREYLRCDDGSLAALGESDAEGAQGTTSCGCGATSIRGSGRVAVSHGDHPAGAAAQAVLAAHDAAEAVLPADKAAHVARRWSAPGAPRAGCRQGTLSAGGQWERILQQIEGNTFTLSGMAFQDAWTIDLERLRHCYLHVLSADGRLVPFCAFNLTAADGHTLGVGRRVGGAARGPHGDQCLVRSAGGAPPRSSRLRSEAAGDEEDLAAATSWCRCDSDRETGEQPPGCMVCGERLVYSPVREKRRCHYCGRPLPTNAWCVQGHFVCDACHGAHAVEVVREVCLHSCETDAAVLMQTIRSHPRFPIHGPEHHSLVPAVILAALRNGGERIAEALIIEAVERGRTITGGACAFLGACGTAVGVGIALSLLTGADPLHGDTRMIAQQATWTALGEIAAMSAPRCCQRESWLALMAASRFVREATGGSLAVSRIRCTQSAQNRECIHGSCPLWSPNVERQTGALSVATSGNGSPQR
ncbi:MAG TPA: DUF5714 domain-containing protein [Thermoleophilia bacterium]|nr:DUF5714 domain-containing protein [Thermoleophilia bacterium]